MFTILRKVALGLEWLELRGFPVAYLYDPVNFYRVVH